MPPIDGACCDGARPMALPEVDSRELRPRTVGGVAAASECWETPDAGFTPSGEEAWGEWAPSSAVESSSGVVMATAGLRRRRERVDFVRRWELGAVELAGDVVSDTRCGCRRARADGGASLFPGPERGEEVDDFRPYRGRHRERVVDMEAASYLSPASDMAAARVVVSPESGGGQGAAGWRRGFVGVVARGGGSVSDWQQGWRRRADQKMDITIAERRVSEKGSPGAEGSGLWRREVSQR